MRQRWLGTTILCGSVATLLVCMLQVVQTHTPIRSRYTYNEDVFPILQNRCASCHVPDGVAPMSLMTYKEAVPWAASLRLELISGHMPPWYAEPGFGNLRKPHALSGRELDVLLVWASGGTPRGDATRSLPTVTLKNEWSLGTPDLEIPMPSAYTMPAAEVEATREFVLPSGTTSDRWIKAADVRPGTPAIVRGAVLSIDSPTGPIVLTAWLPGAEPTATSDGTAFRVPAGAQLKLRVHYKKTWKYEDTEVSDRTTVGLYFADESTRPINSLVIASDKAAPPTQDAKLTFSNTVTSDVQALALRAPTDRPNVLVQVEAVRPNGERIPLIRLNTRPSWDRRYWFDRPVSLPRGTRIEVVASVDDPLYQPLTLDPSEAPAAKPSAGHGPIQIVLDVAPAARTANGQQ